jgi:hypothetical protein
MARYQIRIDPAWRPLLGILGGREADSYAEVSADGIHFRFGPWFDRTIARSKIASASRRDWPWWMGVGWRSDLRGLVGLIGSTMGVVEIRLTEPLRRWAGLKCDRIAVSFDDPDGFLDEILAREAPPKPRKPAARRTVKAASGATRKAAPRKSGTRKVSAGKAARS